MGGGVGEREREKNNRRILRGAEKKASCHISLAK